jgi:hypothetical protein
MQILILKNTHYAMDEEMKNLIGDVEVDDFVLLENLNSKRLTSFNVLSKFDLSKISFTKDIVLKKGRKKIREKERKKLT